MELWFHKQITTQRFVGSLAIVFSVYLHPSLFKYWSKRAHGEHHHPTPISTSYEHTYSLQSTSHTHMSDPTLIVVIMSVPASAGAFHNQMLVGDG